MELLEFVFDFLINRPIIMMVVFSVPLLAAVYFKACFPTRRMLAFSLIPLLISVGTVFSPQLVYLVWIAYLLFAAIALIDLLLIVKQQAFAAERDVLRIASLGKSQSCQLTITNHAAKECHVQIRDDLPNEFSADIEKFDYRFSPRSRALFKYKFTSSVRGRFELSQIYLKVASRWRFWDGYFRIPVRDEIFVYPDMKQIAQYAVLARTDRLNLLGVRKTRKIGQDNEFERLRDYTQDDNFKFIDWRTSARRRKLTVKDYQANQSQRIIFMVDCGRMMTGDVGGIDLLDYSLNAMLMLSYVALRQGDSVGLICFSNGIHNFTPPRAGVGHINRLLHATFDLKSQFVESRYSEAFIYLRKHCMKRSLVVLITNLIDEINANQLYQYLGNLTTKHLPVGVLLRDRQMFAPLEEYLERPTPNSEARFYSAAAAAKIINWRSQIIADLHHKGVMALDVRPEELTARLINQYLEIKAKHLL